MITMKYGIDMWQCFRLVITNIIDYILYEKTAVFVLPILQWTITQYGPNTHMLKFGYI